LLQEEKGKWYNELLKSDVLHTEEYDACGDSFFLLSWDPLGVT